MEECAGLSDCGRRKGLKEDAKEWSKGVKTVLNSVEGRNEFYDFLQGYEFYKESQVVKFWEQCNEIVGECDQLEKTKSSAGSYDSNATSALIAKASAVIEKYVNSCQINLVPVLIGKLSDSVASENPKLISQAFKDAKERAHDLLKEVHTYFVEELDRKYTLTNK